MKTLSLPFVAGQVIEFAYPAHNLFGLPLELVPSRMRVESTRDISAEPIPAAEFYRRPLERRGSLLVIGFDLELNTEAEFWFEAMEPIDDAYRNLPMPSFRLG